MVKGTEKSVRDRLISAGIEEIAKNGIQNFSVRKVAEACGVSCAAPYKHFKNRQSFIAAVIEYINARWFDVQKTVMEKYDGDIRRQIVESAMSYIRFLVENPDFRSIIMLTTKGENKEFSNLRSNLSNFSKELATKYCIEQGIPIDVQKRKTYVIRSLIYGAALMFDNGQMEYTKEHIDDVKMCIDREFDLP